MSLAMECPDAITERESQLEWTATTAMLKSDSMLFHGGLHRWKGGVSRPCQEP